MVEDRFKNSRLEICKRLIARALRCKTDCLYHDGVRRTFLRFSVILYLIFYSTFQSFGTGFLQVRNFPLGVYQGGPQNWAFTQDSLRRIYIGNRDGMLSFDGEKWSKFVLPNLTTVRSLLYDGSLGRIYAGGTDEFGYFEEELTGLLKFVSLRGLLPRTTSPFTEVWNIHQEGKFIYFQTDNDIFKYDGRQIQVIKSSGRISTSSKIDGKIFVGLENGSILELKDNSLLSVKGTESLRGKRIQSILPGVGKFLVATSVDGLFAYIDEKIVPFEAEISSFLKESQLFCGSTDGKNYVFGTVSGGAVICNFADGTNRYANRESGMLNNTVLNCSFDMDGNIWLGLDNGLDYVLFKSSVSNLVGASNDVGAGYTSILKGLSLFLGTNQGLYSTPYPVINGACPINLKKELSGQIWSLTDNGPEIFVAGDAGIFVKYSSGYEKLEGLGGGYRVRQFPDNPDMAIVSCYDGFHLLSKEGSRWVVVGKIADDNGIHGDFILDDRGNIWINNWLKGLYRLHLSSDKRVIKSVKLYGKGSTLPAINGNSVISYKGEIVVSTVNGLYSWNKNSDSFSRHPQLNSLLKPGQGATLHRSNDSSLAILDSEGLHIIVRDSTGKIISGRSLIRDYKESLVNGFEHVNVLNPNEVLVGNQYGFWIVNPLSETADSRRKEYVPYVNTIKVNMDSVVYRAPLSGNREKLSLSYGLRSVRFEFGYADYIAPGEIEFSTLLENYEKGWSPYSSEAAREYTKLSEGKYTLHVKVRNVVTGNEAESVFEFTVCPPWYRSVYARILYALLLVGAIIAFLWITRRWKIRAEQKVEAQKEEEMAKLRRKAEQEALQKDYEIASLKSEQLENDIRHKSGELSTATMNLIRKNEILTNLASKISKIQKGEKVDPGTKRQLEQIQSLISENISHDDVMADFSRNFDIVYQNYTKRLREQYGQLTPADIRICCYIKMGLSSKDMAPLLNITVKSVEMARYRLRKKMELGPDVSLTDYLSNF